LVFVGTGPDGGRFDAGIVDGRPQPHRGAIPGQVA
jgi:hypothetical protein